VRPAGNLFALTYGLLTETIGGATDSTNPSLSVIRPLPCSALDWHQPLLIQRQSADSGMGLREVSVTGDTVDEVGRWIGLVKSQ